MQQNNKKCNWPRENKEFKLMAGAWNCFHVCGDCFQASVWFWCWGGRTFEVQKEFIGSHWQDNMVQETIWYKVLQEMRSFCCCVLEFYWEWLSAQAWGCIDLCCREPQRRWWKATGNSGFSIFWAAQKIDKYFIMFQNERLQLTEGPSSPLGPFKERKERTNYSHECDKLCHKSHK